MLEYSPAKLRLFYEYAQHRAERDEARAALRHLQITRLAIASVLDQSGVSQFYETQERLLATLNGS